ncbi:MAG: signal recognition particle-docking protein FtsY, partial [Bacteroidales bacterium]|nr:signal recognition particle-docking protein FtsY [Bacteroidales bacterium]
TLKVIDNLEERASRDKYMSQDELRGMLREEIAALIPPSGPIVPDSSPYIILVVGVNGVGKTTTIGKLAYYWKSQGKKVLLGAADTFRAAAVDQLDIWAERAGVDIIKQQMGSDPAAVAYDTAKAAVARGADVVLIDTAGRLHNRVDLMNELTKIRNSVRKVVSDGPQQVLLVLDASTGQNAFAQAKEFARATDITGIVVTKLDGTAKGGVVVGVSDRFGIPVRFIGTGENIQDIKPFDKDSFVAALFKPEDI